MGRSIKFIGAAAWRVAAVISRDWPLALLAAIALILSVSILGGTWVYAQRQEKAVLGDERRELQNLVLLISEQTARAIDSVVLAQVSLVQSVADAGIKSAGEFASKLTGYDVHVHLRDHMSGLPQVNAFTFIDAQGRLLNFSRRWPIPKVNVSDRDYFRALRNDTAAVQYISNPVQNRGDGAWTFYVARKITNAQGEFLGLSLAAVELKYFEQLFSSITLSAPRVIALLRSDGTLLARSPRRTLAIGKIYRNTVRSLENEDFTVTTFDDMDGTERLFAAKRVAKYPFVISAGVDKAALLANTLHEMQLIWTLAAVAAAFVFAIIGLISIGLWRIRRADRKQIIFGKRQLRVALDNMTHSLCMFDANERLVVWNKRYAEMCGENPKLLKPGADLADVIGHCAVHSNSSPSIDAGALLQAIRAGGHASFNQYTRHGHVIRVTARLIEERGSIVIMEDITAHVQAETAAAEARSQAERAHTRLLDAFEVVPEGLALFDAEDRFVLWNRRYAEMHSESSDAIKCGVKFEDMLRAGLARHQYPDAIGREEEWLAERLATHAQLQSSHEQHLPNGRWLSIQERRTADGGSVGIRIDITELKRREQTFRLLFDESPVPLLVFLCEDLSIVAVNDAAVKHYGYSRDSFLAMTMLDVRPAEHRKEFARAAKALDGSLRGHPSKHQRADGTVFDVEIYSNEMVFAGRRARLAAVIDTTVRRVAAAEIDRQRRFLQYIIDNVPVAIIVKDASTRQFILVNPLAEQIMGMSRDQLIGKAPHDVFGRAYADGIQSADDQVLQNATTVRLPPHQNLSRDDDGRVLVSTRLAIRDGQEKPQYLITVIEDVTERQAVQEQLHQAQKMEAVGNLTGGIAHDFNNLLMAVIGNMDLLEERIGEDAESTEIVQSILGAALRGAELTKQMLAFSRRQPLRPMPVEVNGIVKETADFLNRALGENAVLSLDLFDEPLTAVADQSQLQAALVNIAINARDAMKSGGTIAFRTDIVRNARPPRTTLPDGDYILIEVQDTGEGIPEDILARVFEPFFTTKAPGKGTGLGLSMVYGFMQQSGGHVDVRSVVGKGTTFTLYLPYVRSSHVGGTASSPVASQRRTKRRLLIVDDNIDTRKTVAAQLRHVGYDVVEAEDAQSALARLEDDATIDGLVSDVIMAGMDGPMLVTEARRRRSDLKVLFISGFPAINDRTHAITDPLLCKPFRARELASAIERLFEERRLIA